MVVTLGDAYTTWACLHETIPGVVEVNPIAAWLFGLIGLVPGLVVDGIGTALVLGLFGATKRISPTYKSLFLLPVLVFNVWAVWHNYQIMIELGLT
jgi:hypothetical protein